MFDYFRKRSKPRIGGMVEPGESKHNVLINGVPKSATLFLARVVSENIGCQISRIGTRGVIESQIMVEEAHNFANLKRAVAQQHLAPTEYNVRLLASLNLSRFILIFRDPRDVIVSLAHHLDRPDIQSNPWHEALMYANQLISKNYYRLAWEDRLSDLIDNAFPILQNWMKDWLQIVNSNRLDIHLIKYENFLADKNKTIENIFKFLQIEIDTQDIIVPETKKKNGKIDMNSHYRRGVAGGFIDELSSNQISCVNQMIDQKLFSMMKWSIEI